jgi:hypothetical protein
MRDTLKYLNDILALLTLPIYLLMPLTALAGRALESRAPGHLPPSWAFIATETFQVIAGLMLVWYLIVYMLAIGKLMEQPSRRNEFLLSRTCFCYALIRAVSTILLLAGMLVAWRCVQDG